MIDERTFFANLETADVETLAGLVTRPDAQQEHLLRIYFGDERFQRLHESALRRGVTRAVTTETKGVVVVLHGIMGGELAAVDAKGRAESLWVQVLRLCTGAIERLRMDESGLGAYDRRYDVRPSGILKRYYAEQLLALSQKWTVRPFWYDWRKDIRQSAALLEAHLSTVVPRDTPVHLVAHSMGGLVARAFIKAYPARWQSMKGSEKKGQSGGRLVMLGTPNRGSFAITEVITGTEDMMRLLARIDLRHNLGEIQSIVNSFPGIYQMLPYVEGDAMNGRLYDATTYGHLGVPQQHLDNARAFHRWLDEPGPESAIDPARMTYIAGCNRSTVHAIQDLGALGRSVGEEIPDPYNRTMAGDGTVPHALGLLEGVPTYYVEEDHGKLPRNAAVQAAIDDILATGTTSRLPKTYAAPTAAPAPRTRQIPRETSAAAERIVLRTLSATNAAMTRSAGTQADCECPPPIDIGALPASSDERKFEEQLVATFLGKDEPPIDASSPTITPTPLSTTSIELALVHGTIEGMSKMPGDGDHPLDSFAVGHYLGVRPQRAELAIDRWLSAAINDGESESNLLLKQYTERGTLRGELGRPFFLTHPTLHHTVAIMGMGVPGRFGTPELTILVRELCWSLARLGKRHLCSVLIGSGDGNIRMDDAVASWMRGIDQALGGARGTERHRLKRITFIESSPKRWYAIDDAIQQEQRRRQADTECVRIDYRRGDEPALIDPPPASLPSSRPQPGKESEDERAYTRMTVQLDNGIYRFGAITSDAAIPERSVPIDPSLVMQANDELAAQVTAADQLEHGRYLERLLIPRDLREQLYTDAPLVLLLDSTTARIHWELVAQPEAGTYDVNEPGAVPALDAGTRLDINRFFGTSRGLTRQLRTSFAPPPDLPPPAGRTLRVLVVADPADDARLPGAEEEGVEVADVFERFNAKGGPTQAHIVRLFGPYQATRTNVLRQLILEPWDVLHFAGHCFFDEKNPASSGWVFTGGKIMSARELERVDRVPKFVFSNACESGITPDRSEERNAALSPSFAEAFFARGVTNFVCTAWPVDDRAARTFARQFYESLLGLSERPPTTMHIAMRDARRAIANTGDRKTWGAYQHYGQPYFRLFRD